MSDTLLTPTWRLAGVTGEQHWRLESKSRCEPARQLLQGLSTHFEVHCTARCCHLVATGNKAARLHI